MGKNVAFVSIFDLTRLQFAIAEGLLSEGHTVSWITTNEVWSNWLTKHGVPRQDILELIYTEADFVDDKNRQHLLREIQACETASDLTINQVLQMDRFVLYKNKTNINEYVYLYYRDIKQFLKEREISHVFAEPTNLNDLMTYMICRELGISFLTVWDMRYPLRRLIFADGFRPTQIVSCKGEEEEYNGRSLLDEFVQKQVRPHFFAKHNRARVVTLKKAASATANRLKVLQPGRRRHLTHFDLPERIGFFWRRLVNGFRLRHLYKYDDLDSISGKVAFYGLHVQPENSIDVLGSYFSNQKKLIQDIRRALPFDTTLIVKEHPNFLGLRPPGFLTSLRRIPNVKVIHHGISTFEIYKRASIVFTVTGTTAYEAAMLGVPAVVFVPMFFSGLSAVHVCTDISKLKELCWYLLHDFERDLEADARFMQELMRRSHPGFWTDPLFDASVLDIENVTQLQQAFNNLLETDVTG